MAFKRKKGLFSWLDIWICIPVLVSVIIGFVAIYSSTKSMAQARFLIVQAVAFFIGALAVYLISKIDYDYICQLAPYLFGLNIILLVLVLIFGTGDDIGSNSWIRIGPVGIQPSEIIKVTFIITFAKHIETVKNDLNRPLNIVLLLLHVAALVGLILLQPDMGTALVFIFIAMGMLFIAGIDRKYIIGLFSVLAAILPLAWFFLLKDYQKNRILAFLNPDLDPTGSGYHVLQSKIAIGSGKILGQGVGNGVQTQMGYLPEKQTDFIFAVIGEELGLWGSIILIAALVVIVVRCFVIASESRDILGEMIGIGVGCMFLFHVLENICMCLALLPVTGIPLPFVSYGGSNMLASMLAIALIVNVKIRKKGLRF